MANVITSAGTISPATGFPASTQTIYDGANYWAFYVSSSQSGKLCYRYSSDFSSWSSETTVAYANLKTDLRDFSVIFNSATSTFLAVVYNSVNTVAYLRGVISGTTITWDAVRTVESGVGSITGVETCLRSDSTPAIVYVRSSGANYLDYFNTTLTSSFADISTQSGGILPYSSNGSQIASFPLQSGNVLQLTDDFSGSTNYIAGSRRWIRPTTRASTRSRSTTRGSRSRVPRACW
jgi:hypothetical protein